MRFVVSQEVFARLGDVCFGVVVARGINNQLNYPEIGPYLDESIKSIGERFAAAKVKEAPEILPYRDAFTRLGFNPNKFMSSIEAMASRVAKQKGFPRINPVVDLSNAVSLQYLVPLGAHDLDSARGDIEVRFSAQGDLFIPFGEQEEEVLDSGELIYSVGDRVKTRRWIWRQSEQGKVTEASRNIFFPIDGFRNSNYQRVIAARDDLADRLQRWLNGAVKVGFIDSNNREMDI